MTWHKGWRHSRRMEEKTGEPESAYSTAYAGKYGGGIILGALTVASASPVLGALTDTSSDPQLAAIATR